MDIIELTKLLDRKKWTYLEIGIYDNDSGAEWKIHNYKELEDILHFNRIYEYRFTIFNIEVEEK